MKTHPFTLWLCRIMALCLMAQPVLAQLKLPWEKDEATKPPAEEPVPAPAPDTGPEPGAEPEPSPPAKDEAAAAPTAVEAVYRAWADQIFANTDGKVRIGSPQIAAKKITVSVTLNGERTTMVFLEKSSDGRKARVIAGPKDSEGEFFGAEKTAAGWRLSSWPEGFRGNGDEPEPAR